MCVVKRDYGSRYIDVLSALSNAFWVEELKISDVGVVEGLLKDALGAEAATDIMQKVNMILETRTASSHLCGCANELAYELYINVDHNTRDQATVGE